VGKLSSILICIVLLACGVIAEAQQAGKIPRIGYLLGTTASALGNRTEGFRQGLRELGYIEGKNIIIEWRSAEGKIDRLRDLADELVRLKVDAIVTGGDACR
jgi:putative tryptophan/tyrosine transport system substrate-binding protein